MAEFDYKQRPFCNTVTDDHYDSIFKRGKYDITKMAESAGVALPFRVDPAKLGTVASVPSELIWHTNGQPCGVCGVSSEHAHAFPKLEVAA